MKLKITGNERIAMFDDIDMRNSHRAGLCIGGFSGFAVGILLCLFLGLYVAG